MRSYF